MTYKQPVKRGRGRHELLVSTLRLIASRGLHATTLRDIAGGARLSLGSTTYHFPDRDALMLGALETHVNDTERVVDNALADPLDVDGGVRSALAGLLADRNQVLIRHELRLQATRDPQYRELHIRSRDSLRRTVSGVLCSEGSRAEAAVDALGAALDVAAIENAIDHTDPAAFTAAMTAHLDETLTAKAHGVSEEGC